MHQTINRAWAAAALPSVIGDPGSDLTYAVAVPGAAPVSGRALRASAVAPVAAWSALGHQRLMAGIPLYSAVDTVHDYVVLARGAFDETVLGILRLKDKDQRVEVRVVLHAAIRP